MIPTHCFYCRRELKDDAETALLACDNQLDHNFCFSRVGHLDHESNMYWNFHLHINRSITVKYSCNLTKMIVYFEDQMKIFDTELIDERSFMQFVSNVEASLLFV